MPLVYRRPPRPPTPADNNSNNSTSSANLTDADASIFLSDLVRSGEASRLRRRGAIRDAFSASGRPIPPPAPTPPLTYPQGFISSSSSVLPPVVALPWAQPTTYESQHDPDSDGYDDDDGMAEWEWGRRAGGGEWTDREDRREVLEAEVRIEEADAACGSYMLFCGGEPTEELNEPGYSHARSSYGADTKSTPRRRASAFCPATSPPPYRRTPHRVRRSNGCGALVHVSAMPNRSHGVWIARGAATGSVIGMDASYFDCHAVAKITKSACGCVREGVGCSIW